MGEGMEMERSRERDLILVLRQEAGRGIPAMVMESLGFQVLIARDPRSALSHFRQGELEFRLVMVEASAISHPIREFLDKLYRTDSMAQVVLLAPEEADAVPSYPDLIHLQPPLNISNLVQILNPDYSRPLELKTSQT